MKFFTVIQLATLILLVFAFKGSLGDDEESLAKPENKTASSTPKPAAGGSNGTAGTGSMDMDPRQTGAPSEEPEPPAPATTKKKSFGIKLNAEYFIVAMAIGVSFTKM